MMTAEESQTLGEKHQQAIIILGEIRALHLNNIFLKVAENLEALNANYDKIEKLEYAYDNLICELANVDYKG